MSSHISRAGSVLLAASILAALADCGGGMGPLGGQHGIVSADQLALMPAEDVVVVDDTVGKNPQLHVQPGRTMRGIVASEPSFKAIYRDRLISVERNYPDGRRSFAANPGDPGFDQVLNRGDRVVLVQRQAGKFVAPLERLFP